MKKKIMIAIMAVVMTCGVLGGCGSSANDKLNNGVDKAKGAAAEIVANQPSPTDLKYSLERYNVIRRAYWVNGQREKAMALPCAVEKPLGYIVLFSNSGAVIGRFVVDGKVSSLGSYLFPAEDVIYKDGDRIVMEIAGIDGCYGSNVEGIFFFTVDGKYIEWTGDFLFSDIPFSVDDPILKTE